MNQSAVNEKFNIQETDNNSKELAIKYLKLNGYNILEENYHSHTGKIDIIATKDNVLTFIELKTYPSILSRKNVQVTTFTRQQKIRQTAQYYLLINDLLNNMPIMSFDIIEIIKEKDKIITFKHIQHCF